VAAEKVEEVISELQKLHDPAVQRIILGFTYFKINNFELTSNLTLHYCVHVKE